MPDISDIQPVLSSAVAQGGAADIAGTIQYQPGVSSESAGDVAFAGPIADFILYGVVNGAFAQGPPDPSANIDPINNPMPYWNGPTQVSGGAITAQWVADSASPSGYNLRFTINPGAAGDEAYFEQIIPVAGTRVAVGRRLYADVEEVAALTGATAQINAQYLTASGTPTGAGFTGAAVSLGAGLNSVVCSAYGTITDAAYLRIRLHMARAAGAASGSGAYDWTSVRALFAEEGVFISNGLGFSMLKSTGGAVYLYPSVTDGAHYIAIGANGDLFNTGAVIEEVIFPTAWSGNQNNYAPTGWATSRIWVLDMGAASRSITGIDATGWTEGQGVWIMPYNSGGGTLTFTHNSASSSSGNKFSCPNAVSYVQQAQGMVFVAYLPTYDSTKPFVVGGKS